MESIRKTLDQQSKLKQNALTAVNFEPEQFSEIEMDENEITESLRQGRENKFYRLQREAYSAKLRQIETYKTFTAEEIFKAFTDILKIADEAHEKKIKQLCCYFANDDRFRGDLNKGILLMGNIGNGKTSLMKMFAVNQNHSYRVESMLDISFDYKMHGEEGVKAYGTNYTAAPNMYGKKDYGYCFDDLGTEEIPARHYGESKNIFSEIIQIRYNNRSMCPFNSTHITTNKTESELLECYGTRTYDRMKEMFNVFVFEHGSFRK
jgi:DNA replication protein DnaC